MHFCEGSLLPVVIQALRGMGVFGGEASPDVDALKANGDRYFRFIEGELGGEPYFAGKDFTATDVMMMYGLRWLDRLTDAEQLPNLKAYRARIGERPAYQKAMAIANPPA
jgi:glutathione S-transferase